LNCFIKANYILVLKT